MAIIPLRYRKQVNLSIIIVALIVIGSFTHILPFASLTGVFHGVYAIEWAGIECTPTNNPGGVILSNPYIKLSPHMNGNLPILSGPYYADYGATYECPYIGGCTIEATSVQSGGCFPASGKQTFNYNEDISSKPIISPTGTCPSYAYIRIESYRLVMYPTNLHLLKKVSGPGIVKLGWLSNTANCMVRMASPEFLTILDQAKEMGDFTLSDGTKVSAYSGAYQLPIGTTLNYMVGWQLINTITYQYEGKSVLCIPKMGLYDLVTTKDTDSFVQGNAIEGMSGQSICCPFANSCGSGYSCVDFKCVEDPNGTKGECDSAHPYIDSGDCYLKNGKYTKIAPAMCVNEKVVKGTETQVECCSNLLNSGCGVGFYCGETDYTCHKDVGKMSVAPGNCAGVEGETNSGKHREAFDPAPYEQTPCPDNRCCYSTATSKTGTCKESCATSDSGKGNGDEQTQCAYNGFMGSIEQAFGFGCDGMGMFLTIIVLIILIALIIIILGFAIKITKS